MMESKHGGKHRSAAHRFVIGYRSFFYILTAAFLSVVSLWEGGIAFSEPLDRLLNEDGRSLGDAGAPVVMIVFSDFDPSCYYCRRYLKQTEPQIITKFVNTKKVRYVFRDYLMKKSKGLESAMALRCAASIGDFSVLYTGMTTNARSDAANLGSAIRDFLDMRKIPIGAGTQWSSCINDPERIGGIKTNKEDANALGFTGTPSFIIYNPKTKGTITMPGAMPFEVFEEEIDRIVNGIGK